MLRWLINRLIQKPAIFTWWNNDLQRSLTQVVKPPNQAAEKPTAGEEKIKALLQARFPNAKEVTVADISGGCGAMYHVCVEAEEFRGMRTVMQHRLITETLKDEISKMHGLQIATKVPDT